LDAAWQAPPIGSPNNTFTQPNRCGLLDGEGFGFAVRRVILTLGTAHAPGRSGSIMASLWEKVDETPYRLQAGFGKIILKTFRLPHGEVSHYDIKDQGAVVCVLALTPENKVILAQQFRPGPEQLLLEMPGGCVDAGEAPEVAIRRELLEETGYTGSFHFAGTNYHCGYSNAVRHNFIATGCTKIQEPHRYDVKVIEVVEMPLSEFRDLLRSGRMTNIDGGYMCLDVLGLL
jgi:ADP-ribose pyrophosphatase